MKKKVRIAGLHLWAVKAEGLNERFWITTGQQSIAKAIEKATKFFAKTYGDDRVIKLAEYHGTIDA